MRTFLLLPYSTETLSLRLALFYGARTDETLTYRDDRNPSQEDTAIIFGTSYKLEYRDPFLFFAYEFRKWTLESRIIVVIGYGFGDPHINKIMQQALNNSRNRVLLVITLLPEQKSEQDAKCDIAKLLDHSNDEQINICNIRASEFMTRHLTVEFLSQYLQEDSASSFPTIPLSDDEVAFNQS